MKIKKIIKTNEDCLLATDFRKADQLNEIWLEKRNKKENIYIAIKEYIAVLEKELEIEEDSYNKFLLQHEIAKLKKEQIKYYEPSILEMASFGLTKSDESPKNALEKSSFSIVKKYSRRKIQF